jgi:hypothetical protein
VQAVRHDFQAVDVSGRDKFLVECYYQECKNRRRSLGRREEEKLGTRARVRGCGDVVVLHNIGGVEWIDDSTGYNRTSSYLIYLQLSLNLHRLIWF